MSNLFLSVFSIYKTNKLWMSKGIFVGFHYVYKLVKLLFLKLSKCIHPPHPTNAFNTIHFCENIWNKYIPIILCTFTECRSRTTAKQLGWMSFHFKTTCKPFENVWTYIWLLFVLTRSYWNKRGIVKLNSLL